MGNDRIPTAIIADDIEDVRHLVEEHLAGDFNVIASVDNGIALVDVAMEKSPDLLVVDVSMPELGGIEAIRRLKSRGSAAAAVVLTVSEDADLVQKALDAGALGFVIKCRMATDLGLAIESVRSGRTFVSPGLARKTG